MESRAELKALLADLTVQERELEEKRRSVELVLAMLENNGVEHRALGHTYLGADKSTNVGRAVEIIRAAGSEGITLTGIIQKSAEDGAKPLVATSVGSQLRKQIKHRFIEKRGDRYYALASNLAR